MSKVLIIDDDVDMTDTLSAMLKMHGYKTIVANSSAQGIAVAAASPLDVIILDQMMPLMMGWEICAAIRKFSDVPILVLSVVDKPEIVARTLDAGADDYLIKPVSSGVLLSHLSKLIRRCRPAFEVETAAPLVRLTASGSGNS